MMRAKTMLMTRPQPKGLAQIGTCVVFKRHGTYPAAECTLCTWKTEAIYEDDLA
jgi:hypothetical protein